MDLYILNVITSYINTSIIAQALVVMAASVLIWVLAVWYVIGVLWHKRNRLLEIMALVLGGIMVYLFNILISFLWWRPRPFLSVNIQPLIQVAETSKSFPSDHAAIAFFIAFLLAHYQKKWNWAYVVAGLIAVGRIAAGVHYPLDVLTGSIIGICFGYLTLVVKRLFKQTTN